MLMHHRDEVFYVIRACIVMHNMIRIQVEDEEVTKDFSFYEVIEEDDDDQSNTNEDENMTNQEQDSSCVGKKYSSNLHRMEDYKFNQKRWKVLYNVGEAVWLQDAVKTHTFQMKFPDDEIFDIMEQIDD